MFPWFRTGDFFFRKELERGALDREVAVAVRCFSFFFLLGKGG